MVILAAALLINNITEEEKAISAESSIHLLTNVFALFSNLLIGMALVDKQKPLNKILKIKKIGVGEAVARERQMRLHQRLSWHSSRGSARGGMETARQLQMKSAPAIMLRRAASAPAAGVSSVAHNQDIAHRIM